MKHRIDLEDLQAELAPVLLQHPEEASLIIRLARTDLRFRDLCRDYLIVCANLTVFESFDGNAWTIENADYRQLAAEMEIEIANAIFVATRK